MVEHMIEIIEVPAHRVPRVQRPGRAVGGIKAGAKPAKQLGHRDIRLAVAVIRGRIKDDRLAIRQHAMIAAPQVAMQQRCGRRMVVEEAVHVRHQSLAQGLQAAAVAIPRRQFQLEPQSAVAVERRPVPVRRIDLGRGANGIVPAPAMPRLDMPVHGRQPLAQPGIGIAVPAGHVQIFQRQERAPAGPSHAYWPRRAHRVRSQDGAQSLGFRLEHPDSTGIVELDEEALARAFQPPRLVDAAAADATDVLHPEWRARGLADGAPDVVQHPERGQALRGRCRRRHLYTTASRQPMRTVR